MEHERIRIPAFHRVKVSSKGSLGYVIGNLPFLSYTDGTDNLQLPMGAVLPISSEFVEICNPFSFAGDCQILRGGPVKLDYLQNERNANAQANARAGLVIKSQANGGDDSARRRGFGIMPKRGRYIVNFQQNGGSVDETELLSIPKAYWKFLLARPVGVLSTNVDFYRFDGTINDQVLGVAGSYSDADITAWKIAAGYTGIERKVWVSNPPTIIADPENAVFYTNSGAAQVRFQAVISEMGDIESKLREV